jgi:anti-sigma factor RsiW
MTCQHAAEFIEAIAADEIQPTPEVRAHFETCPSCAAALAAAVRLEGLLAANPPPLAPDGFVKQVLQRARRERWRMEQNVDRLFNVAMVAALVIVAIGVFALMNLSGVVAASDGAWSTLTALGGQVAQKMVPVVDTYIAAVCLLLTALAMWWWAEGRIANPSSRIPNRRIPDL